jgi:hypothetical protein
LANKVIVTADAFTGNVHVEDRYSFGIDAPYHTPVLIESGGQLGPYAASYYGPFTYQGALYVLLVQQNASFTGIFTSSDDGATWTELDSANHISGSGVATPFFDGASTIVVAYLVAGPGQRVIHLKNFDLATATWGADYATAGGPSGTQLGMLQVRPDNTVFLTYDTAPPTSTPPASNMFGAVYSQPSSGGAWTVTALDIGTNMAQLAGWLLLTRIITSQSCFAMDTTGRLHFLIGNPSSGLYGYQAVETNNTLGQFTNLSADPLVVFSGLPLGHPVIIGDVLVVPAAVRVTGNNYATLYTATPLSAPVFTLLGTPGIDPSENPNFNNQPDNVPYFAYDSAAGTLYALWSRADGDGTGLQYAQLRLALNSGDPAVSADWSASTIFDLAIDSPPGFNFTGQELQIPSLSIGRVLPVAVTPAPLSTGGGPYVIPKPCLCDIHDLSLEELARLRHRQRQWPYVHRMPPPGAIRVRADNAIVVPTVAAGETQGIAYTVDEGYLFALECLVVQLLSAGNPGNAAPGDFTWSLDLNKPVGVGSFQGQGIQGFTSVDMPLGSLEIPWPLEMPDIFSPNDCIRAKFFNVALTSGDPNYFKVILLGWRWPA